MLHGGELGLIEDWTGGDLSRYRWLHEGIFEIGHL
jgi:hypothetical protein